MDSELFRDIFRNASLSGYRPAAVDNKCRIVDVHSYSFRFGWLSNDVPSINFDTQKASFKVTYLLFFVKQHFLAIIGSMANPKVSIVMATHNRAHLIGRAIESVCAQTFSDWELIIADDGSTDGTPRAVEESAKKEHRIVYIRSAVNIGISENYNRAFKVASGEYVAMIDDDDPWLDMDKLKKQIEFLDKNPEYVGCGGGVVVINPAGKELYRYLKPETDEEIRRYMLLSNPMANSTTMFRKGAGEKVGWYDWSLRYSGDRDFWLKMGLIGKLYNFPEYFSYYTMGTHNTSIAKMRPHLKASLAVMKRYKGKYPRYYPALMLNAAQYAYSFLPEFMRRMVHQSLARLKRRVVK